MPATNRPDASRILFLDNIRTWIVLIVVLFHVALAYGRISVWLVYDPPKTAVADWIYWLGDVFMMAILFFIAGYFAPASLARWGTARFLKRKAVRLLVPCFLVTVFLNPICYYVWHLTNDFTLHVPRMSYWQFWGRFLSDGLHLRTLHLNVHSDIIIDFGLFHCWFLTLLMLFFLVFAAWERFVGNRVVSDQSSEAKPVHSMRWLFGGSLLAALVIVVLMWLRPITEWIFVVPVISFEIPNVVLYVVYFTLGVVAFRQRWFDSARRFGGGAMWYTACTVMTVPYLWMLQWMWDHPDSFESPWMLTIHWIFRVFYCLSFLGAFITFAQRFANRPSRVNQSLAANSYNIYLLHMIVVILVQWAFWTWDGGSTYIKLIVVSVLSVVISYIVAVCVRALRLPLRAARQSMVVSGAAPDN